MKYFICALLAMTSISAFADEEGALTSMIVRVYSEDLPLQGRVAGGGVAIDLDTKGYFYRHLIRYNGLLFEDFRQNSRVLTGKAHEEITKLCNSTLSTWENLVIESPSGYGGAILLQPSQYTGTSTRKIGNVSVDFVRFVRGQGEVIPRINGEVKFYGIAITGSEERWASAEYDCNDYR